MIGESGKRTAQISIISSESQSALKRDADAIRLQIEAVSGEIAEHEAKANSLRARLAALQEGMAKIESLISADFTGSSNSKNGDQTVSAEGGTSLESGPPPTLVAQIESVMRDAAEPLHYRELLDRLQSQGVEIGGKDPAATLLSVLASKRYESRFARSDRGVYAVTGSVAIKARPSRRRRRRIRAVGKAS
jgi:HB1, ASXL, restriction endonuclease HTH domain